MRRHIAFGTNVKPYFYSAKFGDTKIVLDIVVLCFESIVHNFLFFQIEFYYITDITADTTFLLAFCTQNCRFLLALKN